MTLNMLKQLIRRRNIKMKLTTLKKELFVNFKLSLDQNNNQLLIYERGNKLLSFSNEATNFFTSKI